MDAFLLMIALALATAGGILVFLYWPHALTDDWSGLALGLVALLAAGLVLGQAAALHREMQLLVAERSVPYRP